MQRNIHLILLVTLFSCSNKPASKDYAMEISIKDANSYKYDLKNQIYTVFGFMKKDTSIHFDLSIDEKRQIVDKYHELKLDSLGEKTLINDIYDSDPTLYRYLKVQSNGKSQVINIEGSRNEKDYKPEDILAAKKINEFINSTLLILNSKAAIKNGPKSDMVYF